jgi:hypothetical protein
MEYLFIIAGINDWNELLKQQVLKMPSLVKEWPENDTTMSLEDARYKISATSLLKLLMHTDPIYMTHAVAKCYKVM